MHLKTGRYLCVPGSKYQFLFQFNGVTKLNCTYKLAQIQ